MKRRMCISRCCCSKLMASRIDWYNPDNSGVLVQLSTPGPTVCNFGSLFEIDTRSISIVFAAVPIAQGATIAPAFLDIRLWFSNGFPTHVNIYGEDEDTATNPSTNAAWIAMNRTTASVAWNDIPAAGNSEAAAAIETSPDISSIIQEIVNRAGWSSGNDLQIILENNGSERVRNTAFRDDSPILRL